MQICGKKTRHLIYYIHYYPPLLLPLMISSLCEQPNYQIEIENADKNIQNLRNALKSVLEANQKYTCRVVKLQADLAAVQQQYWKLKSAQFLKEVRCRARKIMRQKNMRRRRRIRPRNKAEQKFSKQ